MAEFISASRAGTRPAPTVFSLVKERIPSCLDKRGPEWYSFFVVARLTLVSRSNLVVGHGIATLAGWFRLGAEASGADVDFSFPSFYHNRISVNIR